jgi:hypothetical protein
MRRLIFLCHVKRLAHQGGTEGLVWTSCPVPTGHPPPSLPPAVLHKNRELLQVADLVALAGQKQLSAVCSELGLPADCRVMVLDALDAWCTARVALICQPGRTLPACQAQNNITDVIIAAISPGPDVGHMYVSTILFYRP